MVAVDHPHGDAERALVERYHEAVARLNALIDPEHQRSTTLDEVRARAERRQARLRAFLAYLGNPHQQFAVVHVGGTSGKGSTAAAIAAMLTAAGYRTGLHLSPYLQVATEKIQLDGRLIAPDVFADLVTETLAAADAWSRRTGEQVSYGEAWMALLATYFAAEHVDFAVIEVGAGGRFDLTNVVQPVVSVITSVGLDHMDTLGPTIRDIAWHKAGIIKPGAPVVTPVRDPEALGPILDEARRTGSAVIRVPPTMAAVSPSMAGQFQMVNAATAVATVQALAQQGFVMTEAAIAEGLAMARLPGRLETVQHTPRVILDGAHNAQKAEALAKALPAVVSGTSRVILVLGVLESKDDLAILTPLLPLAGELVVTRPRVYAKPGRDPRTLAAAARRAGFAGPITVEDEPADAITAALARSAAIPGSTVLVTGSLYLVGNIRGRWYPDDAIVLQRTPWPSVVPGPASLAHAPAGSAYNS